MGLNLFLRIFILVFSVCFGEEVPVPHKAVSGGRMSLPCDISSQDGDEVNFLVWFKDVKGIPIYMMDARFGPLDQAKHFPNMELIGRAFFSWLDQPASLQVDRVTAKDEGIYWCMVYFKRDWRSRDSILQVTVVEPPKFVTGMSSRNVTVLENSNVTLSCKATGKPPPKIKWRREDGWAFTIGSKKISEYINEELHFVGVSKNHAGAYLCEASNDVPPAIFRRIYLDVEFAPRIVMFLENKFAGEIRLQNKFAGENTDVSLECHTEGNPVTNNYWRKVGVNSSVLKSSRYQLYEKRLFYKSKMRLSIRNLQPEDYGVYQCVAENSLGKMWGTIKLHISATTDTEILKSEIDKLENINTSDNQ